jgi:hypothetical protein
MNDWWNDPPDEDYSEDEYFFADDPDRESYYIGEIEPPTMPKLCPHGNEWHECNPCMVAGDLAYDSARERR